jgi:hypothetical protein
VSPKGDRVAFFEITRGLTGRVVVVDRRGSRRFASRLFFNVFGLAWKGEEIWFTAAAERPLFRDAILAITEAETERVVAPLPGNASLHDVSTAGRVLMAHTDDRVGISVLAPGDPAERDLSWLDSSFIADISRDGSRILFTEGGVGGGSRSSVYLRSTQGSPAVRLGDGWAVALSPDGQWAVAIQISGPQRHLDLLPTGAGQARRIERPGLTFPFGSARWLPDGKRLVVVAREKDRPPRLYCLDADGDALDAVTPEALGGESWALSPDGTRVAAASHRGVNVYPVSGGGAPGTGPDGRGSTPRVDRRWPAVLHGSEWSRSRDGRSGRSADRRTKALEGHSPPRSRRHLECVLPHGDSGRALLWVHVGPRDEQPLPDRRFEPTRATRPDLEDPAELARMAEASPSLEPLRGFVVIDECERRLSHAAARRHRAPLR